MRHLMCSNGSIFPLAGNRISFWFRENDVLRIRDHTRVFHRSKAEGGGDSDVIQLLVWVWDTVVTFLERQDCGRYLGCIFCLVGMPFGHNDPDRHMVAARGSRIDKLQRAHCKRDQIARQRFRFFEGVNHLSSLLPLRLNGRVTVYFVLLRDYQGELPRHFVRGFIKTGKCVARINRLKLSEDVLVSVLFHAEDAGAIFCPHLPCVSDVNLSCPNGNGRRKMEANKVCAAWYHVWPKLAFTNPKLRIVNR